MDFGNNMQTMRFIVMMASTVAFLFVVNAQAPAPPPLTDYTCSASVSKLLAHSQDPCANTSSYADLGTCAKYMNDSEVLPCLVLPESLIGVDYTPRVFL